MPWWPFFLLAILLALPLLIAWYTVAQVHRQRVRNYRDSFFTSPFETNIPHERVIFKTSDNIELVGWLMGKGSTRVVIGCHGHHGKKSDLIGISSGLVRKGFRVFIFDLRHCGESQNARQSIAFFEQEDLRAAIEYVASRFSKAKIGIIGYSMGAALSLLVARHQQVKAIVADSSFSSVEEMIKMKYKQWGIAFLAEFFIRFTDKINILLHGYSLLSISPLAAIRLDRDRAFLFLHAKNDSVIPYSHSQLLYQECPSRKKEIWLEEGEHCSLYFIDRQKYITRIATFFRRQLK